MMPTKVATALRRFSWETSRRAVRSNHIPQMLERALQLHIAGRYEDAIAEVNRIPPKERSGGAWRVLGHAEHGRGNYEAALAAHLQARQSHGDDKKAASDDEVNLAAVLISMNRYDDAWAAAERARALNPQSPTPWLPRISILNRRERHVELMCQLRVLLAEMPEFIESSRFRDHLENDADFIGVDKMIASIRSE